MKKMFTLGAMLLIAAVYAADPMALIKEGQAAVKAKDFATAIAKYTEAQNAATNSAQKSSAIYWRFRAMIQQGKHTEARKFMAEAVEDETLKSANVRYLLNELAAPYLWWPAQVKYALDILKQAQNVEAPKTSNDYYRTYYYMACIYSTHLKQYETVIEIMSPIVKITGQHPANKYTACCMIGGAYEKLGKKDEALAAYKEALTWAKKVTYKFSTQGAEKAIERLSK